MPTIRDLVAAIRQRDGVDAAVVLGRDGLLIDSQTVANLAPDDVAAHVPGIITSADEFGVTAAGRAPHDDEPCWNTPTGSPSSQSSRPTPSCSCCFNRTPTSGQLLFELRRNREHIASLVYLVRGFCDGRRSMRWWRTTSRHIGHIIKMKLEQGPFRVSLAYDGREALEILKREPDIQIVLLDLMMPHLSGLDVLAEIRSQPQWKTLPCIILTAAGQEEQHRPRACDWAPRSFSPSPSVRRSSMRGRQSWSKSRRTLMEAPTPVDARHRWAVVLAGGVGSRFWPLSTPQRPKQLLPLVTDRPLLIDTLRRLEPSSSRATRTLVFTGRALTWRLATR